jgi:hypothetical protein
MKLTAEAVQELKSLEDRRGRLTPEQVLEAAAAKTSALHPCFTWDDSEAAAKYRLEEARELIRSVRIEVTFEERHIRTVAYVHDTKRDQNEAGYVNLIKVRRPDAKDTIRVELNAIVALCERAVGIAEAKDDALPGVADRIRRVKLDIVAIGDAL